jgi:hypothetical protein
MVAPASPTTLPAAVAAGTLSPEAAGLLWSLVAAGRPVLVAGGGPREARVALLGALGQIRPGGTVWSGDLDQVPDAGAGTEAGPGGPLPPSTRHAAVVRRYLLLARDGKVVGATIGAPDLEAVFARLASPPLSLDRDELGHLGIVVILGASPDPPARVAAIHWVRPVARDAHDHVQRPPPAVLGALDARTGRWEDFAWAVMPDLAAGIGRRAAELEAERDARGAFLAGLAASGIVEPDAVAGALAALTGSAGARSDDPRSAR